MREDIEYCRQKFGPPGQRNLDGPDAAYLRARRPMWLWTSPFDWMHRIYWRQKRLYREGKIVWGTIVQANSLLFEPGPQDHPADCLYSPDPSFDNDVPGLLAIAHSLYEIKGDRVNDPELAKFSRLLANELDRAPGLRVPHSLTAGRDVFHTAIMGIRKHLPHARLTNGYFPLLVDPNDWKTAMILPSRYWSPQTLDDWTPDA